MAERMTYLLVDGENIDATLGTSILGRRPRPEERPRWDRLLEWAERAFDQDVSGLFFLAATTELPTSFVQALLAIGFKPIPLSGEGKVVDIAIQRTAEALVERAADVVLVSHDGDFVEQVTRRRVRVEDDLVLQVGDALEVRGAAPAHHADHLVALGEQELGQIGAVLTGDSGDERTLGHPGFVPWIDRRCLLSGLAIARRR